MRSEEQRTSSAGAPRHRGMRGLFDLLMDHEIIQMRRRTDVRTRFPHSMTCLDIAGA